MTNPGQTGSEQPRLLAMMSVVGRSLWASHGLEMAWRSTAPGRDALGPQDAGVQSAHFRRTLPVASRARRSAQCVPRGPPLVPRLSARLP